jgi:hypothetical protein
LKTILILYPHFPPSNLAGVHRARLFAQHLPSFGWNPIVLTVHEKYYEEALDHDLEKLLPAGLRIEKTAAFSIGSFRIIGDIGLRAFYQLYQKAKQLIQSENIDFLYIPIPSFYCALLGRWLHHSTKVKYGIDYIDPWVHRFPGSNKIFSRHWFSTKLALWLEPVAVKHASLITGVAEGYYQGVKERNPHLVKRAIFGAMPYGGEGEDHNAVQQLTNRSFLFEKNRSKIQLVYAGAMLPKAFEILELIARSISNNKEMFQDIEFHFIGTGRVQAGKVIYSIKPIAEKYGLWKNVIFEYPDRIAYLDVLAHLNNATGVFILGSTEAHYTPSKTYQAVLAQKPILAVLHKESSAIRVLKQSGAGLVLTFDGESDLNSIEDKFTSYVIEFLIFEKKFIISKINYQLFESYSAKSVTRVLAALLNKV